MGILFAQIKDLRLLKAVEEEQKEGHSELRKEQKEGHKEIWDRTQSDNLKKDTTDILADTKSIREYVYLRKEIYDKVDATNKLKLDENKAFIDKIFDENVKYKEQLEKQEKEIADLENEIQIMKKENEEQKQLIKNLEKKQNLEKALFKVKDKSEDFEL